jgi:hypothetical protein
LHTWGITFTSKDKATTTAYNYAIENTCNKRPKKINMFHQCGVDPSDGPNAPGYHYWEALGSKTNEEELRSLFAQIHQKAEENYEIYSYLNEK